ncbi:MAG: hypothetical protein NZ898_12700 [Myxococcota bacterium]|nr:hypothetical protein [Myxococcota bacterium]
MLAGLEREQPDAERPAASPTVFGVLVPSLEQLQRSEGLHGNRHLIAGRGIDVQHQRDGIAERDLGRRLPARLNAHVVRDAERCALGLGERIVSIGSRVLRGRASIRERRDRGRRSGSAIGVPSRPTVQARVESRALRPVRSLRAGRAHAGEQPPEREADHRQPRSRA